MSQGQEKSEVRVQVKVRLVREAPFWGPGTEMVLKGIQTGDSVRDACRETGISYSKARRIIQSAEKGWQTTIVERQQGGRNGGISRITPEGKERMALFEELEREVQNFAEQKYRELEQRFLTKPSDF